MAHAAHCALEPYDYYTYVLQPAHMPLSNLAPRNFGSAAQPAAVLSPSAMDRSSELSGGHIRSAVENTRHVECMRTHAPGGQPDMRCTHSRSRVPVARVENSDSLAAEELRDLFPVCAVSLPTSVSCAYTYVCVLTRDLRSSRMRTLGTDHKHAGNGAGTHFRVRARALHEYRPTDAQWEPRESTNHS